MAANQIVLDSGALSALGEENEAVRVALKEALTSGTQCLVLPTIVLAETATGHGSRDARINRVAKTCDIVPLDERIARRAAALRFARPQFGVPDAVVVATADAVGGSMILTTDGRDIRVLAAIRGISEVVAI